MTVPIGKKKDLLNEVGGFSTKPNELEELLDY